MFEPLVVCVVARKFDSVMNNECDVNACLFDIGMIRAAQHI